MPVDLAVDSANESYSLQSNLDGVDYKFRFRWLERLGGWYMSIATSTDTMIVSGIRVGVDFPLAYRSTNPLMPPGQLIATDTTRQGNDPGRDDFGTRVKLSYLTLAELEAP